jgi:hypothetical protein
VVVDTNIFWLFNPILQMEPIGAGYDKVITTTHEAGTLARGLHIWGAEQNR